VTISDLIVLIASIAINIFFWLSEGAYRIYSIDFFELTIGQAFISIVIFFFIIGTFSKIMDNEEPTYKNFIKISLFFLFCVTIYYGLAQFYYQNNLTYIPI